MALQSRIKPFDVSIETSRLPTEWETWKLDLESFFLAHGVAKQSDKRAQLAYLGGPGLQELLRHLPGINQVPHVTIDPPYYDVAIKCLDQYFEPFRRKTYERHLFHQIVQQPGERFTDFVMRMRKQIARCSYDPSVVDELIADRIAQGCASEELRTKLLQKDRTLDEVLTLGTSLAESHQQSKKLGRPITRHEPEVYAVSNRPFRNDQQPMKRQFGFQPRYQPKYNQTNRFSCYGCGRRGHIHGSSECPAKHTNCAACGKVGHWAKRCYSSGGVKRKMNHPVSYPKAKRIRAVAEEIEKEQSKDYVFYAMGGNVFTFKVGGIQIPMTIDSGSDANIITKKVWEELKEAKVEAMEMTTQADRSLVGYASKQPMQIAGTFNAQIEAGENKTVAKFYVVEDGQRCLLGDRTAKELNVLKVGFDINAVGTNKKQTVSENSWSCRRNTD